MGVCSHRGAHESDLWHNLAWPCIPACAPHPAGGWGRCGEGGTVHRGRAGGTASRQPRTRGRKRITSDCFFRQSSWMYSSAPISIHPDGCRQAKRSEAFSLAGGFLTTGPPGKAYNWFTMGQFQVYSTAIQNCLQILFLIGLTNIEYSSLCYAVSPCWFSLSCSISFS